jgi:hypothetical protein
MSHTLKESVSWFWEEVFNKGNFVPIDELIGDNYTFNGQAQSRDALKQWVTYLRTQLQGLHFTINDILQDESQVARRFRIGRMAELPRTSVQQRNPCPRPPSWKLFPELFWEGHGLRRAAAPLLPT